MNQRIAILVDEYNIPKAWFISFCCLCFVVQVVAPYFQAVKVRLGLDLHQKSIFLIDCWSVHRSKEFRAFVEVKHPSIIILYIPPSCTSKLQCMDKVINKPVKAGMAAHTSTYFVTNIGAQLAAGKTVQNLDIKETMKLSRVKPYVALWLHEVHAEVQKSGVLLKGWQATGTDQAWDPVFQVRIGSS